MNIMSLDAAYGAGTMQELHQANEDNDYGQGQGNPGATQLQQVPQKQGAAPAAPPGPPGRHVVAQYPGAPHPNNPHGPAAGPPPPMHAPPPPPPMHHTPQAPPHVPAHGLPPMPPPPAGPQGQGPRPGMPPQAPLPFHPGMPVRDQRFMKQQQQPSQSDGLEVKEKKSFAENHKVLIIVFVVVICLVLGILVAVLVTQKKKQKALAGGTAVGGMGGLTDLGGGGVPQYVGGVEFGGQLSSLPTRAWNESASAYLRR